MTTAEDIIRIAETQIGYREGANNYNKYGAEYNFKNNYEQLNRRFGEDPRKLIDEYNLILDKKSNQPVAVREPIKAIVATAINRLIAAKMKEAGEADKSKT